MPAVRSVDAQLPVVSVIIPALNEAGDIGRALAAVLAQDIDLAAVEVVVADGGSSDATISVVRRMLEDRGLSAWQIVETHGGSTPGNLNAALAEARGRVLCRVDARSLIPREYLRRCVELLDEDAQRVVVGGAQVAIARDDSSVAVGIARALNNRWGMGLSRYRRGADSGPTDTVYLGAFRTEELRAAGGWDERFPTNQDFELNRRMGHSGQVWFDSGLEVGYLPRSSLPQLFSQYRRFGSWKVRYWRTTGDPPRPRQLVLLAGGPLAGIGALVWCRSTARTRLAWLCASVVVLGAVEVRGGEGPRGGPAAHITACLGLGAIGAGWLGGVWIALLRPRGRHAEPPSTPPSKTPAPSVR